MVYRVLADLVIVLHFCFVLFVVFGVILALRWRAVFLLHLPALAWGVLVEVFYWNCPLTLIENRFRRLGGEAGYTDGFVEHYIMDILYPDLSRQLHLMLGMLLILWNLALYPLVLGLQRKL